MPEAEISTLREQVLVLRDFMNSRILGQDRLISRMLVALLADGHILVEGHAERNFDQCFQTNPVCKTH